MSAWSFGSLDMTIPTQRSVLARAHLPPPALSLPLGKRAKQASVSL